MSRDISARLMLQYIELKTRFMALQSRERIIIVAGSVLVLLVAIYMLGLAPLYKSLNERTARVTQKQQDLAWMQEVAPRLSALGASQPVASSGNESMVVLIANTASSGNIASALTGQTPDGPNNVRIRLEGVQFDAMVLWLGGLQRDFGIQVKVAEITRMQEAGRVNASLTLTRGA